MEVEFGFLEEFFAKRLLEKASAFTEERALFLKTLMQKAREGHLCIRRQEDPLLPPSLLEGGRKSTPEAPIIRDKDRYYLQKNWIYETHIIDQVKRLKSGGFPSFIQREKFKEALERAKESGKLLKEQGEALSKIATFSVISGGPGTGKTYTAAVFIDLLKSCLNKEKLKICLAAPTGKAASHLKGVLSDIPNSWTVEATTLHRLLRLQPGENRLFRKWKIDADLIIVDEASMIDVPLLAHLLEAADEESCLILMGDPHQLPPVEGGSLFEEMASLFGTSLQQTMRTGESELRHLAQVIVEGNLDKAENGLKKRMKGQFHEKIYETLFQTVQPILSWEEPDPEECLNRLNQQRILGALRQGPYGIDALNRQIVQEMAKRIRPGQWWSIPILITSNEPRLDLYNGTCGVLIGKCKAALHLREGMGYFPGGRMFKSLPPFEMAFCLSIHKSQGSEFERVLALFPQGSEHFGREALYTAITRAKKDVEIIAEEGVLPKMLQQVSSRTSGFTERIS